MEGVASPSTGGDAVTVGWSTITSEAGEDILLTSLGSAKVLGASLGWKNNCKYAYTAS